MEYETFFWVVAFIIIGLPIIMVLVSEISWEYMKCKLRRDTNKPQPIDMQTEIEEQFVYGVYNDDEILIGFSDVPMIKKRWITPEVKDISGRTGIRAIQL